MRIRDIAKKGLKGRKKDTLLLKLVIILSFIFIITSTVFEASVEKTKLEQRLDLYGEWHAAYLGGNEELLEKFKNEPDIDKIGTSLIIGESDECGVVGTFNQDLIDMGRFSLYKGRYPEAPNEIMVELNQMSSMNLDLEVGQKIQVEIPIHTVKGSMLEYIKSRNKDFKQIVDKELENVNLFELDWLVEIYKEEFGDFPEDKDSALEDLKMIYGRTILDYSINHHSHHETPFEKIGDITVVASNDYLYYYFRDEEMNPEVIREKGLLRNQKIILKKEFVITGILNSYTDKWDLGGHAAPNTFLTEEGGKELLDAFYGTTVSDNSNYEMDYNIFLYSDSEKDKLYSKLADKYPNREESSEEAKITKEINEWSGRLLFFLPDDMIDEYFENRENVKLKGRIDEFSDDYLESAENSNSKMDINTDNFRKNRFSYQDDSLSTEYLLTITIVAIIFIATTLAIFQIFLTQMKRRAKKIVLLKSIGATNGQIIKMLLFEGLYLLRSGLLFGIPIGFGTAALVIFGMNYFGGRSIQFHVIPSFILLGLASGVVALFLGMAVPMIFAIRIPLVGTMSKPPKHKKIKHKSKEKGKIRRQTFGYINWRYFSQNKGKSFISFGISLITITIMLTTTLLCFISFNDYRTIVLANNRPDYAMETFYGARMSKLSVVENNLRSIDGIVDTEVYKVGKKTFLWYEGIEEDKLLQAYKDLLPTSLLNTHFSNFNTQLKNEPEWIKNAYYTRIYGINPDSELFSKYSSAVTEGTIDKKKFAKGEEVILLVPMYFERDGSISEANFSLEEVLGSTSETSRMKWLFEKNNVFNISYDKRYRDYYNKPEFIKPGDFIKLSSDDEKVTGSSYVISHTTKEVKVGGIIYYFPDEGVWPFSESTAPYTVISSISCMEAIYPNSRFGLYPNSLAERKLAVETLYPNRYGRTLWYLKTDSIAEDVILDSKVLAFANNNGYTVYNYKQSNSKLYQEGLNNSLIIGLLGITAASISLVILYNTMVSKMEQDKNRIGILQSIGVKNSQFNVFYLKLGLIVGLVTILLANILLALVMLITSIFSLKGLGVSFVGHIKDIFLHRLWLYPWTLHFVICIVFLLLTVLIYYLPSRKVTKQYPVENIRSLGR